MLVIRSLPILVVLGTAVLLVGAAGDLLYHLFDADRVAVIGLATLVGADGYRAHLVTLVGMVISVIGLVVRAVQTR